MSEPISPIFGPHQVYQFISDPSHKENLSGRVRAACITCRKKKIKCSGELNCRTCREKGLVCEGLSERKRPSKDANNSIILDPVPSGRIERRRKSGSKKMSPIQSPHVLLDTPDSDSGYGSTLPESTGFSLSPASSGTAADSTNGTMIEELPIRDARSTSKSPAPRIHTWHLRDQNADTTESSFATNVSQPLTVLQQNDTSSTILQSPVDWTQVTESNTWWPEKSSSDAPSLILAAQALEEQAQSLRLMATGQSTDGSNDLSRRQTITFPLPSSESFEHRYDMLQNPDGIFDDLALLFANRTPGPGLTPNMMEFAPWWNVDDIDFLQAHHNMHDPLVTSEQQQTDFAAPTVAPDTTVVPPPHASKSDGNYLAQFWPD